MISITDLAKKKILEIASTSNINIRGKEGGLRIAVIGGGCSGFHYDMTFEKKSNESDLVFFHNGITFITDKKSALFLSGLEIDYVETLMKSEFKMNNPNAKTQCGCGKSWN